MELLVYQDLECDDIPDYPGIYAFFVSAVNEQSRAAASARGDAVAGWRSLIPVISERYTSLGRLTTSQKMQGSLRTTGVVPRISHEVALNGRVEMAIDPGTLLRQLGEHDLPPSLEILAASTLLQRPLYVGITRDQTLRDRYLQHRDSYYAGASGFGARFRSYGLSWELIRFYCIPLRDASISDSALSTLETITHFFANPILSKR